MVFPSSKTSLRVWKNSLTLTVTVYELIYQLTQQSLIDTCLSSAFDVRPKQFIVIINYEIVWM